MKLNISYPSTGCQKLFEINDDHKIRIFYDKRIGTEIFADSLGEDWKGYIFKISGGNDKQGFPMKQGVLTTGRVQMLLSKKHSCFRPRRDGQRRRKSVKGCIVDSNISVVCLKIVRKGEKEIPGLTDKIIPRRLGPKRANNIRKLFNLCKKDDVRQYVIKRQLSLKEGKKQYYKAPKIQRLITPIALQRQRRRLAFKKKLLIKHQQELLEYKKLLARRHRESKLRQKELKRRRTTSKSSIGSS